MLDAYVYTSSLFYKLKIMEKVIHKQMHCRCTCSKLTLHMNSFCLPELVTNTRNLYNGKVSG